MELVAKREGIIRGTQTGLKLKRWRPSERAFTNDASGPPTISNIALSAITMGIVGTKSANITKPSSREFHVINYRASHFHFPSNRFF